MSLATKYRPTRFEDVVGQENVTTVLTREMQTNTTKQAYLFVGKTGTGKSTSSRILANSLDSYVIEVDAASNSSVDSMRNLLDTVKTRPLANKYTVVIIDECHNLSPSAVQALLMTLEQPPKHLVFILCTTEVDKVPQTIYNRCEVFEFVGIPCNLIQQRLVEICKEENFEYNDRALEIIAKLSEGSMRQAITYLEQCSTMKITVETVKQILLADSYDNYLNLVYSVLDNKYETIVSLVKNVNNIDKYVSGLFSFVLDVDIYLSTKDVKLIDIPDVYVEDFNNFSDKETKKIKKLRDLLLDLQFEGRDNPILKQLLIASMYKFMEEE